MKTIALCVSALLMSSAANAAVVHVTTRPIAMGGGASSLVFNYNENGRAWIEEKDTNGYSEGSATSYLHYHLPGLRFNPATREIMFGRVVCANVVPMAMGYSVYKTGRCDLHAVRSSRRYETDEGIGSTELENIVMDVH